MKQYAPIFIIGFGRSGSTIFHQLLSRHSAVSWLSVLNHFFPRHPKINRAYLRLIDLPILGGLSKNLFKPGEYYRYWNKDFPGFSRSFRDLTETDVTPHIRKKLSKAIEEIATSNRPYPLIKITGWPRVGFLKSVFPNAKFIHVVRDPRAAVSSILKVPWWFGWEGPPKWRWGDLPKDLNNEWKRWDYSFVALAAIQFRIYWRAFSKSTKHLSAEELYTVKYEELCSNTSRVMHDVVLFCSIGEDARFERFIKKQRLKNMNYKWSEDLSDQQKEMISMILIEELQLLGYD